jgi:peptidoglycan/xylan/chitin deacetylase (PgdA/CDA1 family)/glycosyltransferase involved in cell wall biosynthesis
MISIVIPALNEEKLLPDCLKSMKGQSYQGDYEILVIDNGSTDSTADIARNFGVRVIYYDLEKNVFAARQFGAENAAGDIIIQADADTIYPPQWLQRIADQFAAHPKASSVAGRFFYSEKFRWAWLEFSVRNILNLLFSFFFKRPLFVSGATFAFRREAFMAAGGYKGLTYSADQYGISGRLKRFGKIIYDPKILVFTSPRTVRKPSLRLLGDVGVNAYHLVQYWVKSLFTPHRRASRKRRLVKGLAWSFSTLMACVIAFSAYGYFVPASPVFGKVYYKSSGTEKVVALTFDDGPNEPYTSQVLDILKENDIQATFFVIGKNVELYPDVARRILAEGSILGNHSYTHDANHALSEFGARDLERAETVIAGITGVSPHLYRPPHGKKTPWELLSLKHNQLIEVTWSVTANDQHKSGLIGVPDAKSFAASIVRNVRPGSIILLHDGYGTIHNTGKADKSLTVEALPLIIQQLRDKGYSFVTVPVLLGVPAYNEAK